MSKRNNTIELMCVQLVEWFKELAGFTDEQFLDYMNKNNVWDILNDDNLILGCISAEEEDIITLFGGYLSKDERLNIISQYSTETTDDYNKIELKNMQSEFVIKFIMEDNKCSRAEAAKIWYNSKTKHELHDGAIDYTFVSPARCYDELLMELSNDPHWMKGQFE